MSAAPQASVITIFRDAERFLDEAIASVEAQTLPRWELLLVDDGSRDGSTARARAHAARAPDRIRYLEHPGHANLGMSASRNLGLREARAPYVAFLDADDLYLPDRLARHVAALDAAPAVDLVRSESLHWLAPAAGDGPGIELRLASGIWPDGAVVDPPAALLALLELPSYSIPICDVTVRRDVALARGGFEESFRSMCEDRVFLVKMLARSRLAVCGAFLAKVRSHAGSCTRTLQRTAHLPDGEYQRGIARYREWTCRHLREVGVAQGEVLDLVRRWEAPAGPRLRGRFMSFRTGAFAWLERHAPRAVHDAVVRAYHRAVNRYTLWHARRFRRAAR